MSRVVLLTPSLICGGAERTVVEIAIATRHRGWDVTVVTMMRAPGLEEELTHAGIRVICLGMRPGRLNLVGVYRFLRYILLSRPDLIHSHMFHSNMLARLVGVLVRVPVVCTIHSIVESNRRRDTSRLRKLLYRLTDRACFRTTAISETVRQRFVLDLAVPGNRIQAIPSFVDTDHYRQLGQRGEDVRATLGCDKSFLWLAVGRLDKAKDYPNLIEAFRLVHDEMPSAHLAIVGEGDERNAIERLINQVGLGTSISLLGLRTDVVDLMNECDAFVLGSAWEGMPLVLLEAAACESLIVATDVGGAREVVIDGVTGFLVSPMDSIQLGLAMLRASRLEPAERRRLGALARKQVVQRYSRDPVCEQYALLYEETLASRKMAW